MGLYNVRGLGRRLVIVRDFFLREKLDVMILGESFVKRSKDIKIGAKVVAFRNEPSNPRARAAGGTAIAIRDGVAFEVLRKVCF